MERTVLITGAGSGIGFAAALEAARLGFSVVAAVHDPAEVAGVRAAAAGDGLAVDAEVLDVTDAERAREIIERTRPWAVVNNAGYAVAGALEDVPIDEARREFDAMLFAPLRLAQLALPLMRQSGGGRIVNVVSVAADAHLPLLGCYQAVKAALSSLSDVLRQEVAHYGVEVVVVEPGVICTPIWDKLAAGLRRRREDALEPHVYDRALQAVEETVAGCSDVEDVATTIGKVLRAGHPRYRYRVGTGATAIPLVDRVLPTGVRDRVTRAVAGL